MTHTIDIHAGWKAGVSESDMLKTQTKRKPAKMSIEEQPAVIAKKPKPKIETVEPMDFEAFLAKLGPRDKLNVEKHALALEADPNRADVWRRLAALMMTLAPHSAKTTGQQTLQYFVADGKYRMQVLALHDGTDEKITVYVSTTLQDVFDSKVIGGEKRPTGQAHSYEIVDSREMLSLEELDSKSVDPAPYYKDMLGWNRKAVRITLLAIATPAQLSAAEAILAHAAKKWVPKI